MRRFWNGALVVLAVIVFGAAGYVVLHTDKTPSSGATLDPVPGPSTPAAAAPSSSGPAGEPVVAYLGDDWTSGAGASAPGKRFTSLLAADLKERERNFGEPGTGYARATSGHGAYRTRVAAVAAARPDVVVVSGGRNDVLGDPAAGAAQAGRLFARLRAALPGATLIAISPWWGDSAAPPELGTLAAAVKQAVEAAGGTYLDVPDPIRGHPNWMADAGDPNDRGYAALAAAVLKKLPAPAR